MYYTLDTLHNYDEILEEFVKEFSEYCRKSELQFLSENEMCWNISKNEKFEFLDYYYINYAVPVFSRRLWDNISKSFGTDGVFLIPIVINYYGEKHYYYIGVPSRIAVYDSEKRIISENIGRYTIFKSSDLSDNLIYISKNIADCIINLKNIKIERIV